MTEKKKDYSQLILAIYKSNLEPIDKKALEELLNLKNNNYTSNDFDTLINHVSFLSDLSDVNRTMLTNILNKMWDDIDPITITRKKYKEYLEYERRCLERDRLERLR